jgi:hypothetical protein
MTAKPMTDDELHAITAASAGFRGRFAYVPDEVFEIERLAFVPDGVFERDVDNVVVISDDLEPHVIEPMATMLNAVPRLLAEVERLTREREADAASVRRLDLEVKRSGEEIAGLRAVVSGIEQDNSFAWLEIEELRAAFEENLPASEPDAEVLAAPVRCDCCSVTIPAGDSAVMFTDEQGRECWAHYGRCPEPEMWRIDLRWWDEDEECWDTSRKDPRPYEDAHVVAHRFRRLASAHRRTYTVRLVRVRKEVIR